MRKLQLLFRTGKRAYEQNEQRKCQKVLRVGKNVKNTEIVAIVCEIIRYLQMERMEYNNSNKERGKAISGLHIIQNEKEGVYNVAAQN